MKKFKIDGIIFDEKDKYDNSTLTNTIIKLLEENDLMLTGLIIPVDKKDDEGD